MKRTWFDRFIGFFSPSAEANRLQARFRTSAFERAYDVAKTFPTSSWTRVSGASANTELKDAIAPAREKARDLSQNAPYGVKANDVIAGEVVGTGVTPQIKGRNKSQVKRLQSAWKEWAETTECDFFGRNNYYGLQELAIRSTVEAGEGLGLKDRIPGKHVKIKLIEPDFIDTTVDNDTVVQGVELSNGKRVKYHLFKKHPGDQLAVTERVEISAANVIHVYRQKRAGQVRGISWAHAVIEKLKDFDDYQYAALVAKKSQACLTGVITSNEASALSGSDLKEKRENELAMQPGMWRYLRPGEDMKTVSPPSVTDYPDFNRETLRAIAGGWGISYEAMTGDYSQSNYSSSRMGHIQMRKNIEMWRWNMFIPQFCEPTFKWFLEWAAEVKGLDVQGVTAKWVPPAYTYIDPIKEIQATKDAIRTGLQSWRESVREQGRDPEEVASEIIEDNKLFDESGIVLDCDPRRVTQQGMNQAVPPEKEESQDDSGEDSVSEKNKTEDPKASDQSGV